MVHTVFVNQTLQPNDGGNYESQKKHADFLAVPVPAACVRNSDYCSCTV